MEDYGLVLWNSAPNQTLCVGEVLDPSMHGQKGEGVNLASRYVPASDAPIAIFIGASLVPAVDKNRIS